METLEQEEEPPSSRNLLAEAEAAAENELESNQPNGFWVRLKRLLRAICAPKRQTNARNSIKTAEHWRDESRAKNPWWGNGI